MFPTRFTAAADTIYSALVRGGSHTSPMGVYYRNVLKHCGHKEVGLNLDTLPLSTRKIHAHRAHASPCTPMYRVFPFKLEMRGWRWMENLSRAIIYLLGKKRVLFTLISNIGRDDRRKWKRCLQKLQGGINFVSFKIFNTIFNRCG